MLIVVDGDDDFGPMHFWFSQIFASGWGNTQTGNTKPQSSDVLRETDVKVSSNFVNYILGNFSFNHHYPIQFFLAVLPDKSKIFWDFFPSQNSG